MSSRRRKEWKLLGVRRRLTQILNYINSRKCLWITLYTALMASGVEKKQLFINDTTSSSHFDVVSMNYVTVKMSSYIFIFLCTLVQLRNHNHFRRVCVLLPWRGFTCMRSWNRWGLALFSAFWSLNEWAHRLEIIKKHFPYCLSTLM